MKIQESGEVGAGKIPAEEEIGAVAEKELEEAVPESGAGAEAETGVLGIEEGEGQGKGDHSIN